MKAKYRASCAVAAILAGLGGAAHAADADTTAMSTATGVEEIVVTAQRRDESVQKVPMTVQALTGATLKQLSIENVQELVKYTPNVTYASNGPGQGNIFMRGLSTGFLGGQSSSTIASFPNVAVYLDDQSMSFPSRNEDIYMVDMERVEVLEGPQGALFGGGAEAGALRYITNKPKLGGFEANAEASYGLTAGGGPNASGNLMINIPLIQDKLAVRIVAYDEHQGGYIDNVASTFTRNNADPGNFYLGIPPTAGRCPNGGVAPASGFCTIPNQSVNNSSIAGKNSNPTDYQGLRASLKWQVNPDWDVLITESLQNLDAEGSPYAYPYSAELTLDGGLIPQKPLQNNTFVPSWFRDRLENTAWTVSGKVGPLKAVYTGGYSDRKISNQQDYVNYSRTVGGILYECTGPASYWGGTTNKCYSPLAYWNDQTHSTHLSNEIRFNSPDDWRIRFIAGGYQENFRIYDVMNFNYKTIPTCTAAYYAAVNATDYPCLANIAPLPGTTANDPSARGDATGFGEDTQRGYDQYALFGSFDFDIIPGKLTISAGTRWYDYDEFEVGSQYSVDDLGCVNVPAPPTGPAVCYTGGLNINAENYHVSYHGFKSRANLTWHVDENTLAYFTFSQGFRPGGFNRSNHKKVLKDANGDPQFEYNGPYAPDSLNNYEIGVKTTLLDHRLQLNLSAYYMDWDDVQFAIFDPPVNINTTFIHNGPSYNVKGLEGQFVALPYPGVTVQGSASYNHDTQTSAPCLISNISTSPTFGHCVTEALARDGTFGPFPNPFGDLGSVPAFSPEFEGNIRVRYDWKVSDYNAFVQVGGAYIDSMYSQPASYPLGDNFIVPTTTTLRYFQPGYGTLDASIGVSKGHWRAEIYGTNLTNSHASTFTTSGEFIKSEVPLRPAVVELKIGASF
jgi:outer membrane receptor protein involved in Fe transport